MPDTKPRTALTDDEQEKLMRESLESRALFDQWLEGEKGTEQAKFAGQLLALTE